MGGEEWAVVVLGFETQIMASSSLCSFIADSAKKIQIKNK
jgi:hypothetical protein